jgi:uncharacterized protein
VQSSGVSDGTLLRPDGDPYAAIAPAWHTVVVLLVMLGFSAAGARTADMAGSGGYKRMTGYAIALAVEWSVVAFIWYAARRRGVSMRGLVGGRWQRPRDFFRDAGIGIAFVLVCGVGVVNALGHLLKVVEPPGLKNLFPHGAAQIVVYLLLSLTAGFCEEVIFRGYLCRQFGALTRSAAGGIVFQGIVFGAAHGYQGWKLMLVISVYGCLFGLLVHWRKSLRPGMIAHALQDAVGGLANARFS